jgi:F0F1-type ATP synthase membrane subunit c/vacuolar-type H+-ATPase subunit K
MERTRLYLYLAVAAAVAVLLAALAQSYMAAQSANADLERCRQQQREMARAIMAEHMPDMQAARSGWAAAHQAEYRRLQEDGITVEADYLETPYLTAALDPANPYCISLGHAGQAAPGEVIVGLGQYYEDNLTRASGWVAYYVVNQTAHTVSGFTAALAQGIAYCHYEKTLAGSVYNNLGVSSGAVLGHSAVTLDTSYLEGRGLWQDVTEYRYQLRNTNLPVYLTVKTYINGTTEEVEGVEVSQPYYSTAATIAH